ncbi:MAG: urease accessory protein UreE [Rhodospirillum sp.]|nr:urease accessory protein UreE [Rhodospirillum sp.]MCF8488279.1 urease accessory protein UreE [Rhodospirillum sp.]MCF8500065.1 urease accessory protein UreE [Rhodospirillum sp.]
MRKTTIHHAAGSWSEGTEVGSVTLAFSDRHRRRVRMTDDGGEDFLLDLPNAVLLRDGDGLELGDAAGIIRVIAARESVIDIHCLDPGHLARMAWHLGNRHLAVQVRDGGTLRIAEDHVIEAMVKGLGGITRRMTAPFEPEGGAYEGGGHHGHGQDEGQDHGHDHGRSHAPH